jgi:hypothetical protein
MAFERTRQALRAVNPRNWWANSEGKTQPKPTPEQARQYDYDVPLQYTSAPGTQYQIAGNGATTVMLEPGQKPENVPHYDQVARRIQGQSYPAQRPESYQDAIRAGWQDSTAFGDATPTGPGGGAPGYLFPDERMHRLYNDYRGEGFDPDESYRLAGRIYQQSAMQAAEERRRNRMVVLPNGQMMRENQFVQQYAGTPIAEQYMAHRQQGDPQPGHQRINAQMAVEHQLGRSLTPTERAQLARMGDEVTAEGLRQIIGEEEFTRYFDPDGSGDMSMNLEIGGEIRQEQYLRDQQYRMARRRADETGQPQRYLVDPDNPDPRLRYGTLLPNTPEYRQRIAGRSGRRSEQRYAETQARIRARRAERQTDIEAANAPVESDEQWRQSRYAELMDESTSIAGQIEELENRESLAPAEQNRLESLQEEHQRVSGRMDYYEQQQQRAEQAAATPQTYRESWDAYRGQTMELVQSGLISYQQAIAQFEPTAYLTESQLADPSIRNEVSRQMQQFRRAAIQYSNQPEALEALYKDMVRWLNNYITGEALPLSEAQQVDDRIRNYDVFEVNPDLADESLLADEVERIQTAYGNGQITADQADAALNRVTAQALSSEPENPSAGRRYSDVRVYAERTISGSLDELLASQNRQLASDQQLDTPEITMDQLVSIYQGFVRRQQATGIDDMDMVERAFVDAIQRNEITAPMAEEFMTRIAETPEAPRATTAPQGSNMPMSMDGVETLDTGSYSSDTGSSPIFSQPTAGAFTPQATTPQAESAAQPQSAPAGQARVPQSDVIMPDQTVSTTTAPPNPGEEGLRPMTDQERYSRFIAALLAEDNDYDRAWKRFYEDAIADGLSPYEVVIEGGIMEGRQSNAE